VHQSNESCGEFNVGVPDALVRPNATQEVDVQAGGFRQEVVSIDEEGLGVHEPSFQRTGMRNEHIRLVVPLSCLVDYRVAALVPSNGL
jgi:hypothetical protein